MERSNHIKTISNKKSIVSLFHLFQNNFATFQNSPFYFFMSIFAKQPIFNKHLLILREGGVSGISMTKQDARVKAVLSREKSGMAYRCNLCVHFVAFTLALFLSHFVRYHASDPNFRVLCGINGCSKTYRNCIRSFIFVCGPLHYHVMNGQAAEQENGTNDMNSDSSASEMDEDSG